MVYQFINENIFAIYQRQGNDKNGNPIFIVNFFQKFNNKNNYIGYSNVNYLIDSQKKDKYRNIKIQSYNIHEDVKRLYNSIIK